MVKTEEEETKSGKPVCGEEAVDLLNCVTQSPYDHDKCLRLLNALRACVQAKNVKKFSLAGQEQKEESSESKKP